MDTGTDKYPAAEIIHDEDTGEFDGPLREEPSFEAQAEQPQRPAPLHQEIIPDGYDRAADGAVMRTTANTGGQFIDLLEDGQFSADVQMALRRVAAQMTAITDMTHGKSKGRVTLTLDLEKEGETFSVRAKVTEKAPELPRPKSVVWQEPGGGAFTRFPPNQTQMFGMRPAPRTI